MVRFRIGEAGYDHYDRKVQQEQLEPIQRNMSLVVLFVGSIAGRHIKGHDRSRVEKGMDVPPRTDRRPLARRIFAIPLPKGLIGALLVDKVWSAVPQFLPFYQRFF